MRRRFFALLLALCLAFAMTGCGSSDKGEEEKVNGVYTFGTSKPEKNAFTPNKTETFKGYSYILPEYFGDKASNSNDSTNYYYAEQEGKVSMLMLQVTPVTGVKESEFKSYVGSYMMGVQSSLTNYKSYQTDYMKIGGHSGYREYFDCTLNGMVCNSVIYVFLDDSQGNVVSFFYSESENTEFTYFKDVQQIIDSL